MMHIPFPLAQEFEVLGFELLGGHCDICRFKAFFGAESHIVEQLWRSFYYQPWLFFLKAGFFYKPDPVQLLWALLFLRRYGENHAMAITAGVSEKTFRKWSWFWAAQIADCDKWMVSLFVCLLLNE
jgi:hypothetical protein